jgi:trk system potassium uptake protein TrkH
VTGVTILDTATHWSLFGQIVLLLLIEIGGLGFMSIWVLLLSTLGNRPNLKQRLVMTESFDLQTGESVSQRVGAIIRFALIVQLIGALLLAVAFVPEYGLFEGVYNSVFHSVSAFTNGGLDLFSNSLLDFQTNGYVLIVMMLLIMTGGLGFIVWEELLRYRKTKTLSIYTKIVLITTSILWVLGAVLFWLSERNTATFHNLSPVDKVLNYLMLSVTTRSSGFTNVHFERLNTSSMVLTNILIFIGASSGSTGGGIKVSTLAVIMITIWRTFQGKKAVIYGRTLSRATIQRAFFIFVVAIFFIVISTFALSMTETLPPGYGFEYLLTEVVSALGAVGITLGLTPHLSVLGKLNIIVLMIIGRVGVLTFLWSIVGDKRETRIKYPETDLLVG